MSTDIKQILDKQRKQIIKELEQHDASGSIAELASELREPHSDHTVDAANAAELEQKSAVVNNLRSQLKMVEHALNNLEAGTYGLCDLCRQPIDPERLEALPCANLCIKCKASQAKNAKGKHFVK